MTFEEIFKTFGVYMDKLIDLSIHYWYVSLLVFLLIIWLFINLSTRGQKMNLTKLSLTFIIPLMLYIHAWHIMNSYEIPIYKGIGISALIMIGFGLQNLGAKDG